ncbi:MAG: Gfo/Idh/MocA family oxidoreductase [Pseudomonadota bacterium]
MKALGVGLIGCGNISKAYLQLGPQFGGFEIRAVADIDAVAAKSRATEFGVRAMTVEELLNAADIDVVVNLTIPSAHFEVSAAILEAGKHVYSEKPLVLTLEEGAELRRRAERAGLRVGCAPDTFLGGAHQQVRALIDEGAIGKVVSGTAHVMGRGMEHWHPNPDFFFRRGAGPVLDVGPYYITNLIQLLGPVARVGSMSTSATPTRTILSDPRKGEVIPVETPTTIHALLEFASGAIVTLGASWDVQAHRHAHLELYGTKGSLFAPDPNFFGGQPEIAGPDGTIRPVDPWDHPLGRPNVQPDSATPRANYRTAGLADMIAAIRENRAHRCALELALHAVDAMTSILRSGESGAFMELSTTCERPAPLNPRAAEELLRS